LFCQWLLFLMRWLVHNKNRRFGWWSSNNNITYATRNYNYKSVGVDSPARVPTTTKIKTTKNTSSLNPNSWSLPNLSNYQNLSKHSSKNNSKKKRTNHDPSHSQPITSHYYNHLASHSPQPNLLRIIGIPVLNWYHLKYVYIANGGPKTHRINHGGGHRSLPLTLQAQL
jgi:hypothetical protein